MNYPDAHHDVSGRVGEAIQALRRKGALLWIQDGALCYRAPRGLVTDQDLAILRRADGELISLLLSRGDPSRLEPRKLSRAHPTRTPLAFSQLAHWRLRAPAGYRPIRQLASAINIRGRLDIGALEDALSTLIDRHEALRTKIINVEGTPVQEVQASNRSPLEILDLSAILPSRRDHAIQQQIQRAIKDVSDYALDPLFRLVILKLGERESVVIVATDHMISDGASMSILMDELLTAHAQLKGGHGICLPAVSMQYPDYAFWQRAELADRLKGYAQNREGWPRTRFPDDPPVEEQQGWGAVSFVLKARSKIALHDWARSHGVSQVMAALTAYVALVLRWCDVSETIIQVMSDGRMSGELQKTVGYVAFPHYLRVSIGKRDTFLDLLQMILKEYCRACEEPDFYYSYARVPRPEFTRNTCFNWLPTRTSADGAPLISGSDSLTCSTVPYENPLLKTLELDSEPYVLLTETTAEIIGEVGFPRKRFSVNSMSRFAATYGKMLETLMKAPTSVIWDIPPKC